EAGRSLSDSIPSDDGNIQVHGPNGFLRVFEDTAPTTGIIVESRYDDAAQDLVLAFRNTGAKARGISIKPLAYSNAPSRRHRIAPGQTVEDRWAIAASDHWYDVELRSGSAVWRLAGHAETGRISRSDPAMA